MYKLIGVLFIILGLMLLLLGILYPITLVLSVGAFYIGVKNLRKKTVDTTLTATPLLNTNLQPKDKTIRPTYSFNVAGTTFNNGQTKLKSLANEYLESNDAYDGYTNKEIEENGPTYQVSVGGGYEITLEPDLDNKYDKNAIMVIHDELGPIGYVPKESIRKVKDVLNTNNYKLEWELVGGRVKEYDDDDEKVVTNELNYGINITLSYAD